MMTQDGVKAIVDTCWVKTQYGPPYFDYMKFADAIRTATIEEAAITAWSCGMDWHMRKDTTDVREVGSNIAREIRNIKPIS